MKPIKILLVIPFLLLIAILASCNDELPWEISPESGRKVILQEVDGVILKFCLLNEAGDPAVVFKEGENFSFFFSTTNNRKEKLFFNPTFAQSNENEFCGVYTSEGLDIGKPYNFLYTLAIGISAYPLEVGETKVFQVPWTDLRDEYWFWEGGTFESTEQNPLKRGRYYTQFTEQFRFRQPSSNQGILSESLTFKINFRVK